MELDREERLSFVLNALHGAVVEVAERYAPARWQRLGVEGVAVVLTGDVAAPGINAASGTGTAGNTTPPVGAEPVFVNNITFPFAMVTAENL